MYLLCIFVITVGLVFQVIDCLPCAEEETDSCVLNDFNPWDDLLMNISPTWDLGSVSSPAIIYPLGVGADANVPGISAAILTVPAGPVMVAAQLGQGRVIVASHRIFAKDFDTDTAHSNSELQQLKLNMRNWLSNNTYTDLADICKLSNANQAAKCLSKPDVKIIYHFAYPKWNAAGLEQDMVDFVENGGAVLMVFEKWWIPYFVDIPFYESLYIRAGIIFSDKTGEGDLKGGTLTDQQKEEYRMHNIVYAADRAFGDPNLITTYKENLISGLDLSTNPRKNEMIPWVKLMIEEAYRTAADNQNWDDMAYPNETVDSVSNTGYNGALISIADRLALINYPRFSKIPGIDYWPGDVPASEPLIDGTRTYTAITQEIFTTGYHHSAGRYLRMSVLSEGADYADWQFRIGSRIDSLDNISPLIRWERTFIKRIIRQRDFEVYDPYGGLIYLEYGGDSVSTITVMFYQVVEAPRFDLTVTTDTTWNMIKNSNAPDVDCEGNNVTFSVPRSSIADVTLEQMTNAMIKWDEAMTNTNDLRGTDPTKVRRIFFSPDMQITHGWLHAGYPICTQEFMVTPNDNRYFVKISENACNFFGPFHEMGHNFQREEWTWDEMIEVTNNIFTLYNMDLLCGQEPWTHSWLNDGHDEAADEVVSVDVTERLKKYEAMHQKLKSIVFVQLQYHFGWNCYKQVFRWYENNLGTVGSSNQARIDMWVKQWSLAVDYSLVPLFEFWGLSATTNVKSELSTMTSFMPNDKTLISQAAIDEANRLADQYDSLRDLGSAIFCENWNN